MATLRKNVAVLWVPPAGQGVKGKKAGAERSRRSAQLAGRHIGVIGRSQSNVNLLQGDPAAVRRRPDKVEIVQFAATEAAEAIRSKKADAFSPSVPSTARSPRTRSRHRCATAARRPSCRSIWPRRSSRIIRSTMPPRSRPAASAARPPARRRGQDDQLLPPHRRAQGLVGIHRRRLHAAAVRDPPHAEGRIPAGGEDRDARTPTRMRRSRCIPAPKPMSTAKRRPSWIATAISSGGADRRCRAMGSAGAWFGGLPEEGRAHQQHLAARAAAGDDRRRAPQRSIEELDEMQAEADEILRDTLDCYEHGAIEEGTLTAFQIALEQFHNAVADRKALLFSCRRACSAPAPSSGPPERCKSRRSSEAHIRVR